MNAQRVGLLTGRIDKPFLYFPHSKKDKESEAHPQIIYRHVFAKRIPWFIQKRITEITRAVRDKYTVLILSPTRNQCRQIYEALKSKEFQNVRFTEKDATEVCFFDGLKLLLEKKDCNLGWRIVAKTLLPEPDFESLLRQTNDNANGDKLIDMVPPELKKKVKGMLTTLRAVRDKKNVDKDAVSEVLEQLEIDICDKAIQTLGSELRTINHLLAEPGVRKIPIEVTTFQSAKGLEADYVFITHFDDQYCLRNKEVGISDQDVCSFLVALTRAKREVYLMSTDMDQTPTFLSWIDRNRIKELSPST